jgi:hypothetical protein
MCPTVRAPPRRAQRIDTTATYLGRAHNCEFVPWNRSAILNLSKEEAMLTASLSAFLFRKEGSKAVQPLAGADE